MPTTSPILEPRPAAAEEDIEAAWGPAAPAPAAPEPEAAGDLRAEAAQRSPALAPAKAVHGPGSAESETTCSEGFGTLDDLSTVGSADDLGELEAAREPEGSPEKAGDAHSGRGCSGCGRRRACCLSCCTVAIASVGLLLFLLWPRTPEWQVQRLIVPADEMKSMVAAFTSPGTGDITVNVGAVAELDNPNFVTANTEPANVMVSWKGHEMSRVTLDAMAVVGRGTSKAVAQSTSVITPELSKLVLAEVMKTNFMLQVTVEGEVPVRIPVLFGLRVKAEFRCLVDVSVLKMMSDPDAMVSGHTCTYSARL